jgi:hypothetical protein
MSSLSGLNLSVDVERSVIVFAAQVASEVTSQLPQASATTSQTVTPGGAPSAAAAIPQPSSGTTAPTPLSTAAPVADSTDGAHFSASAQETQKPMSLVQQVLDALKDTKVESHKVQKSLMDFFEKLRED